MKADDLVDAGRCWRDVAGDGPPVVLVHGTMDRSSQLRSGRARRSSDLRVARYDRRGYGRSVDLGPPESFGQQVDDLLDVVGWVAPDGPAPVVFGHSYGGTIALAAAAEAPERIAGVVAFEAPLPWTDWWPAAAPVPPRWPAPPTPRTAGEAFMRRMVGDARWEKLPPSTRAARRAEGPTLVAELAQLARPAPAALRPRRRSGCPCWPPTAPTAPPTTGRRRGTVAARRAGRRARGRGGVGPRRAPHPPGGGGRHGAPPGRRRGCWLRSWPGRSRAARRPSRRPTHSQVCVHSWMLSRST